MRIPPLVPAQGHATLPEAADGDVEIWREDGQICAYGYAGKGHEWMHVPNLATFQLGTEVAAFPMAGADPEVVRDAFERSVLPMAIQALGGEALHGSGVAGGRGVVALCADSGTGKSTLAYALGLRGHEIWADDAVAFESDGGGVTTVSLPFRLNIRPESRAALGSREVTCSDEGTTSPLAAVVVLERAASSTNGRAAVSRLGGGEALRAALEQGYSFRPGDQERTQRMTKAYLELVAEVPVYRLVFVAGFEGFDGVVDVVEQLVR
jgi:hypothetical protein